MGVRSNGRRGLVLGGGGVTGIAWMTGVLMGLDEAGVDLSDADLVVGTSAGSIVGAQLTTGLSIRDLYDFQVRPPTPGPVASIGARVVAGFGWSLLRSRGDLEEFGRRLGAWSVRRAASGRTPTLAERYDAIRERLPILDWPEPGRLVITAVDVETGRLRTFDGSDATSLLEAAAASCAVPAVYPPVPIGGRTYIDGGARSGSNADLTLDCDRVVALTPVDRAIGPMRSAGSYLSGRPHVVVAPDAAALKAIGKNVLDTATRPASARAGRLQAASVADEIRELWERA